MPPPRARTTRTAPDRFQVAQVMHQQGRLADAEAIYQEILRRHPRHAHALHFLGVIALQTGRAERGVRLIEEAIAVRPHYAEALGNLGVGYADLGRHEAALASYDRALALQPDLAQVHDCRGNALRDLGRPAEAVASFERAITLRPDLAEAFSHRGNALYDLRRYEDALASHDQALALQPRFVEAHCNRGIVLRELGRHQEALQSFDTAISLAPRYAAAYNSRGNTLRDLGEHQAAVSSFAEAIALKPDFAEAHNNHGNALQDLGRYEEALASYDRAIALHSNDADPHYNRGNALMALHHAEAALASYDAAIALRPDYAEAHNNRGTALMALHQVEAALLSYGEAIASRPDYAEAFANRGTALRLLRRYEAALVCCEQAFSLDPDWPFLLGDLLFARRQLCRWPADERLLTTLADRIAQGQRAALPFVTLALCDSPELQQNAAAIFLRDRRLAGEALPAIVPGADRPKIHIGYFSADFHDHATMHLMIDLFACHDRTNFELTAFSFGPDSADEMRRRAVAAFDRFIDVRDLPDREVALLARSLGVDIAVDLKGFTTGARSDLFRLRAAPVQASYLGYPGTMGSADIDYIIADHVLVPPEDNQFFGEQIVRLPGSYQVNQRNRAVSSRTVTKAEQGLPDEGFVFCCFNNSYKLTPAMFDTWMAILKAVDGAVLWLFEEAPEAAANLRRAAAQRDVSPERLIFAQRAPLPDHLARHRLADLFLDTLPCNAHTTASDALWAGVPVLTCRGRTFAGRVAASLLRAIDLPELITTTQAEYQARAVTLASDPAALRAIRTKLAHNRLTTPLFDPARFARHLETGFRAMHERARAGLAPADIDIDDTTPGRHAAPQRQ